MLNVDHDSAEGNKKKKGFFFFLISKNFIYTNGYSVQEKHRANPEKTSKKQRENEKENKEKKGESH